MTRLGWGTWLWLGVAGCTAPPPAARPAEDAKVTQAVGELVTARVLSEWFGKPPLREYRLDVTVKNPTSEWRWLLLPATFAEPGAAEDPGRTREEGELQIFKVSDDPPVIVVEGVFADFWAVKLPGGAGLSLRGLKVQSWWSDAPAAADLTMVVAKEIRIDGKPIEEVVGRSLESHGAGDVRAPQDAGDPRALPFWHPADRDRSAALVVEVESQTSVRVPLAVPRP